MLSARYYGSGTRQARDEPELSREQRLHPKEQLLEATHKERTLLYTWGPASKRVSIQGREFGKEGQTGRRMPSPCTRLCVFHCPRLRSLTLAIHSP